MWPSVTLFSNTSVLPCQSSFHEFFTLTCMLYRFATELVILHASTASMFCSRFTPDVVLEGSAVDLVADRLERLYSNALRWLNIKHKNSNKDGNWQQKLPMKSELNLGGGISFTPDLVIKPPDLVSDPRLLSKTAHQSVMCTTQLIRGKCTTSDAYIHQNTAEVATATV